MSDKFENISKSTIINRSYNANTGEVRAAVGGSFLEKRRQIQDLEELISLLGGQNSNPSGRASVIRNFERVKEELENEAPPNEEVITNWLKKAGSLIKAAEASAEIIEKAKAVFGSFGLSF